MSSESVGTLYSPSQVARTLGLHVRTVRRYVREGRLPATRIGKQYRISRGDLQAFAGCDISADGPPPANRQRGVEVSSVVQMDAVSPAAAMRISNGLNATAQGRPAGESQPLQVENIYNEATARLKVIVSGDLDATAYLLKLIEVYLEP